MKSPNQISPMTLWLIGSVITSCGVYPADGAAAAIGFFGITLMLAALLRTFTRIFQS